LLGTLDRRESEEQGSSAVLPSRKRFRLVLPLIVETKLRPPHIRDGLVQRSRLVDRLRAGRDHRLTLVCAPAGYGKTTLLSQWAAEDRRRTPFAWLSLDEGDADPVVLWNQLILALHAIHPPAGARSANALAVGARALSSIAIPLLIQELADAPEHVLVLEDWHLLRNPLCDETMTAFVERAPESVQIVISSRADPGLPLARLRAHGDLAELRAEQLRLLPDESRELFRQANVDLHLEDIGRLTDRTEGWAAGLHLVSIALRDQPEARAYVEAFSGDTRHVLDYLARDVFDAVPEHIRDFLLRTSILDTLSAPLCDRILGISTSATLLAEIEHANLFLVPLDESSGTYRYHQLFGKMLQRELALTDPGLVSELHARTSAWYEEQGHVEPAVAHAIASRDLRRASDLVTRHAREYWSSGRTATLTRWLDALSWPEARADPQLAIVRATILGLTGHPADDIERWVEVAAAETRAGPLANGMQSLESGVALLRAIFLTHGLEIGVASARRALELEGPGSAWRRQALTALGQTLYLLGKADEARPVLEEARRLPDAPGQAPGAALTLSYLAFLDLDGGREKPAERLARDALALLEERHLTGTVAAANPELALGGAHMLGTDLHGAIEHLTRAVALSAPLSPNYWHVHALLRLADALHRVGDASEAEEALESARLELQALPDAGVLAAVLAEKEHRLNGRPRREGFLGDDLSESELRVLRLLADGRSLRDVARELFLSLNTVKTHRRTIYRKLGVRSREEAIERAGELGVVEQQAIESPG
jgi:LuxR family transcriptional regulator, maltose regulon positive regulatory protein